jgi:anti-sigma B factor antagonist
VPAPIFDFSADDDGHGNALVSARGELDIGNTEQLEECLAKLAGRHATVMLDLRELTFMDSTGLRVMVSADARARDDSRRLAVVQGPESVHRVFRITGLDDHLEMVATPEAAVRDGDGA